MHRKWPRFGRRTGLLLASKRSGGGGGGGGTTVVVPSAPAPELGDLVQLNPNFTAGPTGKCRYRHWDRLVVSNRLWVANGWDQPFFTDSTSYFDMGSEVPTTAAAADSGSGSTFPAATELTYYFCGRNTALLKETAPLVVTYTMAGTKDASLTWGVLSDTQLDKMAIYRLAQGTGDPYLVAEVTMATGAYTDSTNEDTLITNRPYVRRYRTTKPPIFAMLARSGNRFWAATGKDSLLYYGQTWDVGGEWLLDDFPSAGVTTAGGVMAIAPNDGLGPITAILEFFEALYIFKRRGCYRITGRGTSSSPFDQTLVFSDRGCLAPGAWTMAEDTLFFLDERGICVMGPDGTVVSAAALEGTRESPLAPRWARLNLDAVLRIHLTKDLQNGWIIAHVPLDDDPAPEHECVYDYRSNTYVSFDSASPSMAAGTMLDATGGRHECRVCDLGAVLEEGIGDADVLTTGDSTGTLTAHALGLATVGAATFFTTGYGLLGAPVHRLTAAGVLLAANRVTFNSATVLTLQFYEPETVTTDSDLILVGGYQTTWRSGVLNFGSPRVKKRLLSITFQHEVQASSQITVKDFLSDDADRTVGVVTMSDPRGKTLVPIRQWGFRWGFQIETLTPNMPWSIPAADIDLESSGEYRQ